METLPTSSLIDLTVKLKEVFSLCTGKPELEEYRSNSFKLMNEGIDELKRRGIKYE